MVSPSRFQIVVLRAGIASFLLTAIAQAATVYVDAHAAGANNGTSWPNAFVDLQAGLAAAQAGDEIWLADGTYTPVPAGGPRSVSFRLRNGVAIYGGFAGTETSRDQRDWMANASILSGAGSSYGVVNGTGSYHVIDGSGTDATAVLDGVTIYGGNAADYTNPNVECGAGLYVQAGSPTVRNCLFLDNYAGQYGGGAFYANSTDARLTNCRFVANTAEDMNSTSAGGGLYCTATTLLLTNCTFSANYAGARGSALAVEGGRVTVVNCTFLDNPSSGLYNSAAISAPSSTSIINCIIWGNRIQLQGTPTVTYSCVQGGYAGTGNIDQLPLLRNPQSPYPQRILPGGPVEGNLELLGNSPCINAGLTSAVPPELIADRNGDPRMSGSAVDMGAFEFQGVPNVPSRLYVKASATGSGDGSSWENAIPQLRDAMRLAYIDRDVVREIWVAQGTYTPSANGAEFWEYFVLAPGVAVYGGFEGGESALDQRDWNAHRTVLSGDLNGDDGPDFANTGENSAGVLAGRALVEGLPSVIDGLTITAGNAKSRKIAPGTQSYIPFGGGVRQGDVNVIARNCRIISNQSRSEGSAWSTLDASFDLYNCLIAGNRSELGGAVAIGHLNTVPRSMVNCTVAGNQSVSGTAGIVVYGHGLTITNCIFWNPAAKTTAREIWQDTATVTYSCVRTGYTGTGNFTTDPQFVSLSGGEYRLLASSPCLNAGSNVAVPADMTTDLAGGPRILGGIVDMGAYELVPPCFTVAEQPQSGQTCHDRTYQLCAAASGDGPFTYQWQKDGVDVPGANDACYQASESGRYRCRISNSCAQVLTAEATVTVRQCGFGDFDGDGDVDQADFGTLQACFGPVAGDSPCQPADLDASGSVSTGDLEIFVGCTRGPGVDLDPNCRP